MNRRTEIGLWLTVIALAAAAGLAIAGVPRFGGDKAQAVATPQTVDTVTSSTSTPDTTSTTSTSTTSTRPTTTTELAEPELRPNEQVTVLVVNGTTVAGAAGRLTMTLADQGHPTLTPTSTRSYSASEVWFTGDFGPEAADVAERLGVFPENVMAMPDNTGITVGSAAVIVIVGPDLADED